MNIIKDKKYLMLILILFAIDQITKYLVLSSKRTINLVILEISEVHNTGASFGMFQGSNFPLTILSLFVLIGIVYFFKKIEVENRLPTFIVTAGILGNLTDRIIYGHVIDFINFRWWPIFNFADCCIVIGVIWIGINTFKDNKSESHNEKRIRKIKRKKQKSRSR